MSDQAEEFLLKLREGFTLEAHDQVRTLYNLLMQVESLTDASERDRLFEGILRELHNLKGSARAVKYTIIESLCHPMEDMVAGWKSGAIPLEPRFFDAIIEGVSLIEKLLDPSHDVSAEVKQFKMLLIGWLRAKPAEPQSDEISLVAIVPESVYQRSSLAREGQTADAAAPSSPSSPGSPISPVLPVGASAGQTAPTAVLDAPAAAAAFRMETVRIPTSKLELFMQKAEEMLSVKVAAKESEFSAKALQRMAEQWQKQQHKIGPDLKLVRTMMEKHSTDFYLSAEGGGYSSQQLLAWKRVNQFLAWNQEQIDFLNSLTKEMSRASKDHSHSTAASVDVLLDESKQLLMMPCASLFDGLPIMVRQLSKDLQKEMDLVIKGGEIELDKRILSGMRDPISHLIRNSADHGIETPEERESQGKPRRGKLTIAVTQLDSGQVEIRFSDDGRGIDIELVKESARKNGIATQEELSRMSTEQLLHLIFRSSLSTSQLVTEISGRGVGMAIVEENVIKLGGRVRVETMPGRGCSFVMVLPVSLATFRGVLVDVCGHTFAVPTINIDRVVRLKRSEIRAIEGRDSVLIEELIVPVCPMSRVLELAAKDDREQLAAAGSKADSLLTISILGSAENRVGFIVDEVLEEQEVLVKSLGPVFARARNVSGVTILATGKVVPILSVSDLLKSARAARNVTTHPTGQLVESKAVPPQPKRILVVDDSLTARTVLRNIFEVAGFSVTTVNDGLEALRALDSAKFDMMVTDLEMPNMDGFKLTTAVRRNRETSQLPIIMVTSMTSREHRTLGVQAGANAYFVKGGLEQSNLLEVVESLI